MGVNFRVSKEDRDVIGKIVERAQELLVSGGLEKLSEIDAAMDIIACHANGTPLKLQELLDADDFNFSHDVFGIMNCIDRSTGKMTRCFRPRYSA